MSTMRARATEVDERNLPVLLGARRTRLPAATVRHHRRKQKGKNMETINDVLTANRVLLTEKLSSASNFVQLPSFLSKDAKA